MGRVSARRLRGVLAACAVLLVAAGVSVATPAQALTGYFYLPGDPMIFSNGGTASGSYEGKCTGGYEISGDSGSFLLGAGACSVIFGTVRGTDADYGRKLYWRSPDGNALIDEFPGDDSYQIVRDPLTGRTPGDGHIVGWTPSNKQSLGWVVGKMGVGTGWTEGRITGAMNFRGETLLCTTMKTDLGDAGGPVWRMDSTGLRALGTIQAYDPASKTGCYRPIQETLYTYGASLDTWGAPQGRPSWGSLAPGMPWLVTPQLQVPVDNIPVGTN